MRSAPAFQLLTRPSKGASPFGEVPSDFRVAQEVAFGVSNRVDDDMRPKSRAVLPNLPTFLFKTTMLPRCLQRGLREIEGLVLFSVEPREVLPDNLAFVIALKPLGAGVPARYQARRVEHVNCVVGDAFDQNAVTVFSGLCLGEMLPLFHFSGFN